VKLENTEFEMVEAGTREQDIDLQEESLLQNVRAPETTNRREIVLIVQMAEGMIVEARDRGATGVEEAGVSEEVRGL